MRFIADANILFSLTNSKSVASHLVEKLSFKLIAPNYALDELLKYKEELIKKSGINNFEKIIKLLNEKIIFIDISEKEMKSFYSNISDKKDIIYLFLANKYNIPIWSNDKHLKEQKEIDVFTTKELIEIFGNISN